MDKNNLAVVEKEQETGEYITFACDLNTFKKKFVEIENDFIIKEKYLSTQLVQIQNPTLGLSGIHQPGQPQMIQDILISGLLYVVKKEK